MVCNLETAQDSSVCAVFGVHITQLSIRGFNSFARSYICPASPAHACLECPGSFASRSCGTHFVHVLAFQLLPPRITMLVPRRRVTNVDSNVRSTVSKAHHVHPLLASKCIERVRQHTACCGAGRSGNRRKVTPGLAAPCLYAGAICVMGALRKMFLTWEIAGTSVPSFQPVQGRQ